MTVMSRAWCGVHACVRSSGAHIASYVRAARGNDRNAKGVAWRACMRALVWGIHCELHTRWEFRVLCGVF